MIILQSKIKSEREIPNIALWILEVEPQQINGLWREMTFKIEIREWI